MKPDYRKTIYACFIGYIVQAIVNNFVPLLFLTFQSSYGISLSRITMLVTFNFGLQLAIDLISVTFVDRIGYRASMVIAHIFATVGILLLTVLPELFKDPFTGLLIAVTVYAIGGGLLEVLVSPAVEACPSDNKEKAMSMLHSFYCWGHVGVVLISTVFFGIFGIKNWKILACVWALIPLCNTILFTRVPIASLIEEGEKGLSMKELAGQKIFWIMMLMMLCAGASEQSVSQWASTFAEKGLGVSKTVGDLAGPMSFAILMGSSRALYGKYGDRIDLDKFMAGSSILCIAAYLCIALIPGSVFGLVGCAVCGLSVGIMWPGTFSKAAASIPKGGTALFALMALAGDLGCSGGPTLVGMVSSYFNEDLKKGILMAAVFPLLLLLGIFMCRREKGLLALLIVIQVFLFTGCQEKEAVLEAGSSEIQSQTIIADQALVSQKETENKPISAEEMKKESISTEEMNSESIPTEEMSSESIPTEEMNSESIPTEEMNSESIPTEGIGKEPISEEADDFPVFNETLITENIDYFRSLCLGVPSFDDIEDIDEDFYAVLVNMSIWGPFRNRSETVYFPDCPIYSGYSCYMERISRADMEEYMLLLFGKELPTYEPPLQDVLDEKVGFYYEDGFYYIGPFDPLDVRFMYAGCEWKENGNMVVEFTMWEAINGKSTVFELAPADNENGFIIVSKRMIITEPHE